MTEEELAEVETVESAPTEEEVVEETTDTDQPGRRR